MKTYRRVTKEENPAAWKARAYTRAAPGKFRKSGKSASKTISYRQHQQKQHGGESLEKQAAKREAMGKSAPWAAKARESRIRNRVMKEYQDDPSMLRLDQKIIKKYKEEGFDGLTEKEQIQFKALFAKYPDDDVRSWLGSSEESRAIRAHWKHNAIPRLAA